MSRISLAFACLLLAACQQAPPAQVAAGEKLEPFDVMVGAERWGVLMDKADAAAIANAGDLDEQETLRADKAVKDGAARLIVLRNDICSRGLLKGADCQFKAWPVWIAEPPSAATPLAEIQRRSDWLSIAMDKFVTAGCELGRKQENDPQYCSVE